MDESFLKACLREVTDKVRDTLKNAPDQRKLSKQHYSFSNIPSSRQLLIWDFIWFHGPDPWIRAQSFFYCESNIKNQEFLISCWPVIRHWQQKVDNWGDCDALSKLYTKILELIPDQVLHQLIKWNASHNLWDRRQSLVSLLYFSRTKKTYLPFIVINQLIDNLLDDPEYYVQKAVGWSLKELNNIYPNETQHYLSHNIQRFSPVAFTIATEKIKKEFKDNLKDRRKQMRNQLKGER